MDSSSIVVTTSTNGTCATSTRYFSGARLATAPISRPPALPPMAATRSGAAYPSLTRKSVTSMKSVKVLILLSSLPSSYHCRPISWPPRMCATAYTAPRSTRLKTLELKPGSVLLP